MYRKIISLLIGLLLGMAPFVWSQSTPSDGGGQVFTGGTVLTPILAPNGAAAAPSYAFSNDAGLGFFRPAQHQIGWTVNGVHFGNIGSDGGTDAAISTRDGTIGFKIYTGGAVLALRIDVSQQVFLEALKTTGSAAGKTVVCVNTATGQLYASTSDTVCAN